MSVVFYTDTEQLHRWRLVAKNGNTLADSGEGYASRANAHRAWRRVAKQVAAGVPEREWA